MGANFQLSTKESVPNGINKTAQMGNFWTEFVAEEKTFLEVKTYTKYSDKYDFFLFWK